MNMSKENIKATWRRMPWWAKAADVVALGCVVYTGCKIAVAVIGTLNK